MKRNLWMFATLFGTFLIAGCVSAPLKGITPDGQKVYLGTTDIQGTDLYKTYAAGDRSEADKLVYLMGRIRRSQGLTFHHDGNWYDPPEAYRGSMWMLRKEFEKGETARHFIDTHVARERGSGDPHLVKFPDGSIHIGYYVLQNELELLETEAGG